MKNKFILLVIVILLLSSMIACTTQNDASIASDFRTALDQTGENVTTTFSRSDVIYAVVDLANAPRGTKLEVKWIVVNAEGSDPNREFDSQIIEMTDEIFTGTTFFQLSNDAPWPVGQYRVDLYLNDALVESVEFRVE
jgi:hypothetical protein